MKLIYLTVDGRAKIENTSGINTRLLEFPGSYHPVTNDSVWQDAKRTRPSVMVLIQGVLGPYGSSMAQKDTKHVLYEVEVAERAFKPPSVSKMWMRWLENAWAFLFKYGIWLFIIGIAGYAVITSLMGGS